LWYLSAQALATLTIVSEPFTRTVAPALGFPASPLEPQPDTRAAYPADARTFRKNDLDKFRHMATPRQ
jgi:hypothetical protein